jgi:uncharacterized membrane protein
MQENIRNAVHTELRDWFVKVREKSRKIGKFAIDVMSVDEEKAKSSSRLTLISLRDHAKEVDCTYRFKSSRSFNLFFVW